jgi:predicted S18 family serine protease
MNSIYSGSALRALEKEIKASISFNIVGSDSMNMDHSMHMNQSMNIKTVNIMKRFSAIELNPMAENAMIQFMENEVINDLIDQLILEVSLVDL